MVQWPSSDVVLLNRLFHLQIDTHFISWTAKSSKLFTSDSEFAIAIDPLPQQSTSNRRKLFSERTEVHKSTQTVFHHEVPPLPPAFLLVVSSLLLTDTGALRLLLHQRLYNNCTAFTSRGRSKLQHSTVIQHIRRLRRSAAAQNVSAALCNSCRNY